MKNLIIVILIIIIICGAFVGGYFFNSERAEVAKTTETATVVAPIVVAEKVEAAPIISSTPKEKPALSYNLDEYLNDLDQVEKKYKGKKGLGFVKSWLKDVDECHNKRIKHLELLIKKMKKAGVHESDLNKIYFALYEAQDNIKSSNKLREINEIATSLEDLGKTMDDVFSKNLDIPDFDK